MEKIERWKSNKDVDPEYPFYSRRDEDGTIYYSVPLEAPNDIPVDARDDDAEKYEYSYLPLFGGPWSGRRSARPAMPAERAKTVLSKDGHSTPF